MANEDSEQAQSVPQHPPRKIGYVVRRLGEIKTAPAPAPKPVPYVITDWASI